VTIIKGRNGAHIQTKDPHGYFDLDRILKSVGLFAAGIAVGLIIAAGLR